MKDYDCTTENVDYYDGDEDDEIEMPESYPDAVRAFCMLRGFDGCEGEIVEALESLRAA